MAGTGTIINVAAVLVGATAGLLLKGGMPKRFQDILYSAIGLCTLFIGISGAMAGMLAVSDGGLATRDTMLMIGSLVLGSLLGELLDIERRLESVGEWCRARFTGKGGSGDNSFVEGFVTSSLVFCVGAMAIVGALEDGLNHNYSILSAKAVMDGVLSIVFAASLGSGVYFSAVALAVYQGSITLLAGFVRPFLSELIIEKVSFVGSILIFALGINLVFDRKLKIGNMLPAIFMPLLLQFVL